MPKEPLNKVYHVLNIPEKEQAFIRDTLEDLQDTYIKGKAVRAAGEAAEGFLSNPNLAWLLAGGVLAAIVALVSKDIADDVIAYFGAVERALAPEATDEEKRAAVSDMEFRLKQIIKFFSLGAINIPPPPPPGSGGGSG